MPQEAALTPERHMHRSRNSLLALLVAVLAIGVVTPSALATSQSSASLRGLRPGTSGPGVRHLQKMLAHLGYVVRADGQFGGHTANVVRSFRAAAGLPRSARVTPKFLRMLKRAQYGGRGDRRWLGIRRLTLGAKGRDVKVLQKDLTALGYVAASDGELGPQTRASIRSFERAAGLRIDGVMSPKEARTLKRVVRKGGEAGAVSRAPAAPVVPTLTPAPTTAPTTAPAAAPAQSTGQVSSAPPTAGSIGADGLAIAPAGAPPAVIAIIAAGNQIARKPYLYGGGHTSWQDSGYDCSGSVSFALHGAGLINTPMSSYDFPGWGDAGPGQWVTVYGMDSHAYMVVAGLRFDTSASKGGGSRWTTEPRSTAGYVAVHPPGL
jgi:peptidoglycan hydrolase-like protein with peptidoglycan-binding domain